MSIKRHEQELKAAKRRAETLRPEIDRLRLSIERATDDRDTRRAAIGDAFVPDSAAAAAVAVGRLNRQIGNDQARFDRLRGEMREIEATVAQLDAWVYAPQRLQSATVVFDRHITEAQRASGAIEALEAKRAELTDMRDADATAVRNEQQAATARRAQSLLKRLGVALRNVQVTGDNPAKADPESGSRLAEIDAAIAAIDAELMTLRRELDEATAAADEANREVIEQTAHVAEAEHDEALRIYARALATYREVHDRAFGSRPELPDYAQIADALTRRDEDDEATAEQSPQPKRSLLAVFGGASA